MTVDKDIYSKDKIKEMVLDNSMMKEYREMIGSKAESVGITALIIGGIPVVIFWIILFFVVKNIVKNKTDDLDALVVIAIGLISGLIIGFLIWFIVGIIVGYFVNKLFGKVPTFREFSEPTLLGYELALKRFEVENKIQDYEFMFRNKEFFHGLQLIKDTLKARSMELNTKIKMIEFEEKEEEKELYQLLLERKNENERQVDWLENQLNKLK